MKKNTLDKFMVTKLDIKNSKGKVVTLPTGEPVTIPRFGYKHFVKISTLTTPDSILNYVIDEIKPRDLTKAETEFLLIHMFYHNSEKDREALDTIGIELDKMTITPAVYDFTFDNIRLVFRKPVMMEDNIYTLLDQAYVDGEEIQVTEQSTIELINSLYRYEFNEVQRGVIQEVYVEHEGDIIKGLNIIGE